MHASAEALVPHGRIVHSEVGRAVESAEAEADAGRQSAPPVAILNLIADPARKEKDASLLDKRLDVPQDVGGREAFALEGGVADGPGVGSMVVQEAGVVRYEGLQGDKAVGHDPLGAREQCLALAEGK